MIQNARVQTNMRSGYSLAKDLDLFPLFAMHMHESACSPRGSSFQLRMSAYATNFTTHTDFLSGLIYLFMQRTTHSTSYSMLRL